MPVRFFKSNWEASHLTLDQFLAKTAADGFQGVEMWLFALGKPAKEIREACARHGLALVAQLIGVGRTPQEHAAGLEQQVTLAVESDAEKINCHLGSDFFGFDENAALFARAGELSRSSGLPVLQETHRGRPLFNIPDTLRYLEAIPSIQLTADVSHYMCVHESDLANRGEWLDRIVPRCRYIHARIGFQQGPQVSHPMAPEWETLREWYLAFWQKILAAHPGEIAITPEAGPAFYMPVLPFSGAPVADAWQVNVAVRDWLRSRLG